MGTRSTCRALVSDASATPDDSKGLTGALVSGGREGLKEESEGLETPNRFVPS
jgi:hypothetical protein